MIKFIPITTNGKRSIYEIDVSIVKPKPFGLYEGEELFFIESPKHMYGNKVFSFFAFDSESDAIVKFRKQITDSFERQRRKQGIDFTENDIENEVKSISMVRL